jgi:EAL domain-containing protein (putative c-di-GMP-specific phosphodiesterase class I)
VIDREVTLKASLGLAALDGDSADLVVQNAEAAALAAMHLGGDRSMWFEVASAALVPAEREAQLRGLVESRRFNLHLESRGAPLIPLHGRVPGQYEWQLLWRLGGAGHAPVTLPEMHQAVRAGGAAVDFDRFIVDEALGLRAELLKRGRQLRLAVDLSAHALDDGGLVDFIETRLKERRLSGTGLALTLPASVIGDRIDALVAFCQHAKPLALRVGLRDIGRDMTLVHRLRGVPVDYLRLSAELSAAVADRAGELLQALVRRAHQSGMVVIASGVDSREQAAALQAIGVDYGESPTLGPANAEFNFEFSKWLGKPA